jgi:hypothetical protein
MTQVEIATRAGYDCRYANGKLTQNPYKREFLIAAWNKGWQQAEEELKASDFTRMDNPYSLLNPKYMKNFR